MTVWMTVWMCGWTSSTHTFYTHPLIHWPNKQPSTCFPCPTNSHLPSSVSKLSIRPLCLPPPPLPPPPRDWDDERLCEKVSEEKHLYSAGGDEVIFPSSYESDGQTDRTNLTSVDCLASHEERTEGRTDGWVLCRYIPPSPLQPPSLSPSPPPPPPPPFTFRRKEISATAASSEGNR